MTGRPRILITRTRHQASALAAQLEALGAETIVIPTIELAPPSSFAVLDNVLPQLGADFDWLVFTSANAVRAFADRAREQGVAVRARRIAVIGPATATAVSEAKLVAENGEPVLVPEKFVAESLAESLLARAGSRERFLLVRAEEARDVIPAALEAAGHHVAIAPVYRNITPSGTIAELRRILATSASQPEIITFTSSSTARNLFSLLESAGVNLPSGIALASIGPITSATLRSFGHEPTVEADEATIESLVAAISAHF